MEAVFVQLPCPLGRGFWKEKLSNFEGFSPFFLFFLFFNDFEKFLKGLKPSQIIFYIF